MNKYLEMLKSGKHSCDELPKLPKPHLSTFGSFGSTPGGHFPKIHAVEVAPKTVPDDCAGALLDRDGGLFLPWGPRLTAEDVRRLRDALIDLIREIARVEGWSCDLLNDVLERATCGPLSDLLPNLNHFMARLAEIDAAREAQELLGRHTWLCEGLDNRRWCAGCDGSCIGTSKRCAPHQTQHLPRHGESPEEM
ncbi:hypothetical protein [Paraburkholderia sp. D1E]|uniref:hypothetical protein n=1 Tax=Paraburkholderia sp. D1E TaxID=3461398 RepID=UPI00404619D6